VRLDGRLERPAVAAAERHAHRQPACFAQREHAGVAFYSDQSSVYSVCTSNGAENRRIEPLLEGRAAA